MKGFELIKREYHWDLYNEDGHKIASTLDGCNSKLSTKNCEAIVNGYDLDDLASERLSTRFNENSGYHKFVYLEAYKEGFQKALELMKHRLVEETEWQVEVLMDICGDKVYAVPEIVLDAEGCLILKRIEK